jgi:hypothetical protein
VLISMGEYRDHGLDCSLFGPVAGLNNTAFFDWTIGWHAKYLNGDVPEDFDDRCAIGYSSYPAGQARYLLDKYRSKHKNYPDNYVVWSEKQQCFLSRLKGRTVKLFPYTSAC